MCEVTKSTNNENKDSKQLLQSVTRQNAKYTESMYATAFILLFSGLN